MPELTARVTAWWSGLRNFLIVGALAFCAAIGLALLVEHLHPAPLCERYRAQRGLAYQDAYYPVIGSGSSTTSPGGCIFSDPAGRRDTVSSFRLEPIGGIALLAVWLRRRSTRLT